MFLIIWNAKAQRKYEFVNNSSCSLVCYVFTATGFAITNIPASSGFTAYDCGAFALVPSYVDIVQPGGSGGAACIIITISLGTINATCGAACLCNCLPSTTTFSATSYNSGSNCPFPPTGSGGIYASTITVN